MSYQDLLPLTFTSIIGDTGFKYFANSGGYSNFAMGLGGYVGVVYFLIRSLQGSSILVVNTAWDALTEILENLYAYVVLGERFEYGIQYIGIFLITIGIFCLKIPWKRTKGFAFPSLFSVPVAKPKPKV